MESNDAQQVVYLLLVGLRLESSIRDIRINIGVECALFTAILLRREFYNPDKVSAGPILIKNRCSY